jgi:type II secretory pathway pseudopilin PulG
MSGSELLTNVLRAIVCRPPVKGAGERAARAGGFVFPKTNPPFAFGSHPPLTGGRQKQRGFTYFGVLIIVAVMGMGLAAFGELYSRSAQREKERELLFVGNEYRQAIASYYAAGPDGTKTFPKKLEELVEDKRFQTPRHHLRRLYRDPITGTTEWGLIEIEGGGITGVYSRSEETPVKSGNFYARDKAFEDTLTYKDWVFGYSPAS